MDRDEEPRIREATPEDAEAIEAVRVRTWKAAYRGLLPDEYLESLDPSAGVAQRRAWLVEPMPGVGCLVTEEGDRVVGFVHFGPSLDPDAEGVGQGYALYVEEEFWGTGRGRALWLEARRRLVESGYRAAILWTLVGNARADRFYRAAGFRPDGAEKVEEFSIAEGAPSVQLKEIRYRVELE